MSNSKDDVPLSVGNSKVSQNKTEQDNVNDSTVTNENSGDKDFNSANVTADASAVDSSNKSKSNKQKPTELSTDSVNASQDVGNKKNNSKNKKNNSKKKKKVNLWPLKAMIITFFLSAAVNIASELALSDAQVWLTYGITVLIVLIGVFFDMIGTASTACDIQPFLAMASRKVKGAKTAVKLAKSSDAVSSVCNDIVGDICGIVSGVCAATIVSTQVGNGSLWLSVLVYALISTATITLKAVGKGFAVKKANSIIFATAKVLSIFKKEG